MFVRDCSFTGRASAGPVTAGGGPVRRVLVRAATDCISSPKRFGALEDKETAELRDDLALAKEEGTASKEVISVLRKQLEAMEKEKETM